MCVFVCVVLLPTALFFSLYLPRSTPEVNCFRLRSRTYPGAAYMRVSTTLYIFLSIICVFVFLLLLLTSFFGSARRVVPADIIFSTLLRLAAPDLSEFFIVCVCVSFLPVPTVYCVTTQPI